MKTDISCWVAEGYEVKPCSNPRQEFCTLFSPHTHSCHSVEDLAPLDQVMALSWMRPLRKIVRRAFGFHDARGFSYREICYTPPLSPPQVFEMEQEGVRSLGFEKIAVAITDHNEISGALELFRDHPGSEDQLALGEEFSIHFNGHVFHLGILGLPPKGIHGIHKQLQNLGKLPRLDELFERLRAINCLVILNHPWLPYGGTSNQGVPVWDLLKCYGWAIDALEYNGMRSREENSRVLALAKQVNKPVVGGGDSHDLAPSYVISASRSAKTFTEFIQEVKSGEGIALLKSGYFRPVGWRHTLRVLRFMAEYRRIAYYRGEAVADLFKDRTTILDASAPVVRAFLKVASSIGKSP